jgi:hypothetical protein
VDLLETHVRSHATSTLKDVLNRNYFGIDSIVTIQAYGTV